MQYTAKQFADLLNGREILKEITKEEEKTAKENGLLVLYGYSDDNIELAGEVEEGYYRIKRSDEWERDELGEYCWTPTQKGRGATLFYMADWKFKREVI